MLDGEGALKRWGYILLAFAALVTINLVPLPSVLDSHGELLPLPPVGRRSLAVIALCLVLWITEAVPFAVTGLGVFFLFPASGVDTPAEVVGSGLGHPVTLFLLSISLLSAVFVEVGLGRRVGSWLLARSGGRARRLILLNLVVGALLAMAVMAVAAASILLSVALETLERRKLSSQRSNFGRALLLSTSLGPLIGSLATPAGTGSNLLTIGYLKEMAHIEVTYLDWVILGLPATLLLIPTAWLILCRVFPLEPGPILSLRDLNRLEKENHSRLSRREKTLLLIFGAMLALWLGGPLIGRLIGGEIAPSMQSSALAAALILFLPGLELLPWSSAKRRVPWGTLIVLAGGLAAGNMLYQTEWGREMAGVGTLGAIGWDTASTPSFRHYCSALPVTSDVLQQHRGGSDPSSAGDCPGPRLGGGCVAIHCAGCLLHEPGLHATHTGGSASDFLLGRALLRSRHGQERRIVDTRGCNHCGLRGTTGGQVERGASAGERMKDGLVVSVLHSWELNLEVDSVLRGQGADPGVGRCGLGGCQDAGESRLPIR